MFAKAFGRLLLVGLGILLSVSPAAAFPPPIQTFYVPLPEEQLMASFVVLSPGLADTSVRTTIAITAAGNGTFLYYDHWEDGYELDIANPVQATTQVWGDSNLTNGAPPGCAVVTCDVVNAGRVITLRNDVFVNPRNPATILFDGRDKIGSTLLVAVTQAGWPLTLGTVLADAIDVSSTNDWGTLYEAPGGEDFNTGTNDMFEDARFVIMSQRNGTIVRVDIDDDGTDDIVQALNEGQTLVVDGVLVGTRVFANLPVQVSFLTGDISANYESRWYAMVPRNRWSDSYIAPVGTTVAGDEASVLLYNPHNTILAVNVTTTTGTSSVNVPAGGLFRFTMPVNSGALFESSDGRVFFAIANIDDEGEVHDWGHRLLPATTLAPAVKAGWAPGSDTPATENSSPIWVTAASPTTLNVDWNDDGIVDTTVAITTALQTVQLRDPDGDQTGTRVFTDDDTLIAAAWGQDPNGASTGAPAIDAGTAVLPAPDVSILKNSALAQDLNGNGLLDPGDTLRYTLFVLNTGVVNADNVVVTDAPDPYTTYVLSTTVVGGVARPDDISPSTPFPLDETGVNLGTLTPGQGITITYERRVGDPLPSPQQQIVNTAQVTYGTGVFVSSTHVNPVATPQFNVTKSSNLTGPALPGQTVQYTISIQNTSPFTQTGVSVDDPLPAGTAYVAESTTATGAPEQTVIDLVNAAAYNNNNGTRNWAANWVEAGDDGNVNAGDVRVLADPILGGLRLVVGDDANSLTRGANLSGFPAATLSFLARRSSLEGVTEYVAVQVSANAGPFVEVARFAGLTTGAVTDGAYSFFSFDITPYISGNTQIRFASPAGGMAGGDQVFFDDIRISSRPLRTYRDLFNAQTFANNDGTLAWSTNWTEIGEPVGDVGPVNGDIRVATDAGALRLFVFDDDNAVRRQADLTGFTSATLSFLYRRQSLDSTSEEVVVRVSGDGGANFTQIAVYENGTDAGFTLAQFDISAFISANTVIEFRSPASGMDGGDGVLFDDVQIVGPLPVVLVKTNQALDPSPLIDGDPPNLVLPGDGFTLAPGETMTVTYSVQIANPLVPFLPAILNVASIDSNESLTPTLASRLDPVAPGSIIGDRVWLDVDGDGVQDIGEVGLSNVLVRLFSDPNGVPGSGDEIVLGTVFTDGNGNYLFDGVYPPPSGTVYAEVDATTLPAGLVPSPGNNGGRGPSLTISGSDTFLDVDFGYTTAPGTAVVGDRVWSDADNDGIQDPGEVGIAGVTIALMAPGADGLFGTGDDVVAGTRTTAADGTYLFVGVAPGVYRIDVTTVGGVLAGYTLTVGPQSSTDPTTAITLAAGAVDVSRDFGYRNPSLFSVADAVWDDADGDGVRDAGESGIAGVTVILRSGANLLATTVSDANGNFQFAGLGNGNYTIVLTDTNGLLTSLLATTTHAQAGQRTVTVAGANVSNVSFGYRNLGAIGEIVWSDADGDGVRDAGEPGIAGVTLDLVISGLDGLFGTSDDSVLATRTTAADGTYRFNAVPRGYYQVQVTDTGSVLAGFIQTGDPDAALDDTGDVPLLAGAVDLTMNFGYRNTALADVSGSVFNDTDLDGIREPGENGISAVSLDLVAPGPDGIYGTFDDLVLATTTSDASGNYTFVDVPSGSYRVIVTDTGNALNGYTLTSGLDQIPVNVAGTNVTGINFGYAHTPGTGSIGRRVWLDANRDGVQNPSEDGIPNVTLNLRTPGPDGILGNGDDVTVATATTDANGYYIFTGLAAGDYYVDLVEATLPAGPGLAPTVGTTDPTGRIQLSDGQAYIGANFGYASAVGSALGDSVFFDTDGDGFQDPGEPGIGGVGVTVTGPSGTFNVVTTAAGFWLVTGLAPGTYTVNINIATLPAGYNTTPTNGPAQRNFPVAAGSDFLRADFGFNAPAGVTGSIGDTVFFDANGNGAQNGGEGGISGVTLRLLNGAGSVVATTTTGASGNYGFNGLPPGNYRVEVTDVLGALAGLNLSAGTNPSGVIALGAGATVNTVDFGYAPSGGTGSIGGFVWHDGDGSGTVNGLEASRGIQGVIIDLYLDVNGNGVLNPGIDNLVRTAVTDVIGEYQAFGLPPGSYLVDVTNANGVLTGFNKTSGAAGVDNNSQADPYAIALAAGTSNFTADFGYLGAGTNTVSGTTFFDVAGDGLFNGNDTGIGAVTVYLYRDLDGDGVLDATDPRIGLVVTNAGGNYSFTNLPNGNFIVAVDVTGTFLQSSFQTTQVLTGGVQPVVLSGAGSSGNHFGFNITATLVTLTRFDAYEENGKAVVEWVTSSEIGTLGFYVFRWDPASRAFVQVNDTLLPGLRSPQGGLYRLVDETAPKLGRAAYVLFEAEEGGGKRHYGPFQVRLGEPRRASEPLSPMRGAFERRARRQTLALIERAERAAARRSALSTRPLPARPEVHRNGAAMKLTVPDEGVYFVSASQIAAALSQPEAAVRALLSRGDLDLRNLGRETAWLPAADGSGLSFFGERLETVYTTENAYWLHLGRGRRMSARNGAPQAQGPAFYVHRTHLEKDAFPATLASSDPDSDFWYWSSLMASLPAYSTGTYTVSTSAVEAAGGGASLDVSAFGATSTSHRLRVRINGTNVGEASFAGTFARTLHFDFDASVLSEGNNTIEVQSVLEPGTAFDVVYVESLDLSYPRRHQAIQDALRFTAADSGAVDLSGFTADAVVVDVTDPVSPMVLSGVENLSGTVRFQAEAGRSYFAYSSVAPKTPESATVATLGSLRTGAAEYVVIAPASLAEAARELTEHRESQGLSSRVVTLETIHDELGFGIRSPHNVKAFLRLAKSWNVSPRFVVLVGKGTYDYKDALGKGDNLMPPLMAATPQGLYASDNRLADIVGDDGVPDLKIGRIPVLSDDELRAYVLKLAAFEGSGIGAALFAADNPDVAGNFTHDSDEVANLVPDDVSLERVYLGTLPIAAARAALFDRLNRGVSFWNYIGHGGLDRFANEGLVLNTDVPALSNTMTPFLASLTCSVGRFEIPGWSSLAEAMMTKETGGVVAAWSPSGLSNNAQAMILNQTLVEMLYRSDTQYLGDAIAAALARFSEEGQLPYMLSIYNLLGDPATRLR